jgi:HEAT repeat protein
MWFSYPNVVVAGSVGAFSLLLALLLSKRLVRNRAERRQSERLAVLGALVGQPVSRASVATLRGLGCARPPELARMDRVLRALDPEQLEAVRLVAARPSVERRLSARLVRETGNRVALRRAIGALLLGRLGLPGAAATIAPLLDDPDPDVSQAACRALGLLRDQDAAHALVAAIERDGVPLERIVEGLVSTAFSSVLAGYLVGGATERVRREVIRALGLIGDTSAEPALLAAAASGTVDEQVAICRALATAGTERSVDLLLRMLQHDAWPVRAQAATALGRRKPSARVVTALEDVMGDPAWWVRANAANALAKLGDAGAEALRRATLHPDRYARGRAEEALALIALEREAA